MTTRKDYESESPYGADSPLSYDVEEGELSSGSGRCSPGTIRDNASDSRTQIDDHFDRSQDRITTMRVEVEGATSEQHTQTALNQRTPQEIANIISEQVGKKKQSDTRRNLDSFCNRINNDTNEQGASTSTHSYQKNTPHNHRPQNNSQSNTTNEQLLPPPLPNYPPPVRLTPPDDYDNNRIQHNVQHRWFKRNPRQIRPNNLRFPYAVTPRSNSRKSYFHQSTNKQTPKATVMETIWFQEKDPRT